jgi:hypothetical protein
MAILAMLILSIHEHGMSFHLLKSSSISLFSLKMSLVSFVKFIPSYFVVFEAIAKRIVSLISF